MTALPLGPVPPFVFPDSRVLAGTHIYQTAVPFERLLQAASAVVAARRMVVKGAVSIVENALSELDQTKIGEGLDAERRAAMISNLLVVLVGDREAQPVINAGTLYA